jgi:hypothetical protein
MRNMYLLASVRPMLSSSGQSRGMSRRTACERSDRSPALNRKASGKNLILLAAGVLTVLYAAIAACAQQQPASAQSGVVPPLISFSGTLTDVSNKPITGVTFNLYKDSQGGVPLWMETQNVQPDENGHYSVMLGSTTSTGVPSDVFASGEARWLGVKAEGQEEQPRVLLVAVPYALKAGDAETIGGLPASAFMLANPSQKTGANATASTPAAQTGTAKASNKSAPPANPDVTGVGKTFYLPIWDTTSDLMSSIMSQASLTSTTVTATGSVAATTDFRADVNGLNNAGSGVNFVSPGVRFGTGSTGEAVTSQRASCTGSGCVNNVNGLDLDTDFISRLSITNTGNVGIGTRTPTNPFTVNSSAASVGVAAYVSNTNGNSTAIEGFSTGIGTGVWGSSSVGVLAQSTGSSSAGAGIWAMSNGVAGALAGQFYGNINVTGSITAGTKDFKIDHPSDPAGKYLYHASIESSEMINLYTGNATLDGSGEAAVQLPNWFQAENGDFRYSLTCVGGFAPVYIAEEISGNHFKIAGGKPGMKISWQVTGVRQDAYAKAHPLQVEVEKAAKEQGYYIHPELYGAPEERSIEWAQHPEMMKQMKDRRDKASQKLRASN